MEQQSAEDRWMCALCNKGLTENTPVTDKNKRPEDVSQSL